MEVCRKSGYRVSEWSAEHGIPVSTYYSWQRKVFQAAVSVRGMLSEVPVRLAKAEIASFVQCEALRVDIHAGADTETIWAILHSLKSC